MTTEEICKAVLLVETKYEIDQIIHTCRARYRQLTDVAVIENTANVKVDDRVKLINIRPKYLVGCVGVVRVVEPGSFTVELDNTMQNMRARAQRPDGIVRVHPSCVEKLDD